MSKPSSSEPNHDIAVVGMACRFPHAKDLPSLWRLVSTGEVTFEDIGDTRWKHSAFFDPTDVRATDKTYVRKGAFIDGVDEFAALHYGLAPRRVQVMDPQQRLAIECTRQALQDAGYDKKPFDRSRTGVFIGASVSEYKDLMTARHRAVQMAAGEFGDTLSAGEFEAARAAVADVAPARAFTIAGSLLNMIACSVSQTFDLNGPAMQIDAACSSALVAIHEAAINLRARQCNVALAGGVYLNLNPDNLIGFARIGAISPSGACRPFDAHADGFVMGEGVGLVVLKRLDDAVRDGDRIYAVMRGSGCNNDGRGEGPMTPRPEGQRDAMWKAHTDLDFPVETIGYVETHGTAPTVGDVVEVGALKHFFAEKAQHAFTEPFCFLGSIKANIGHTMSAAGVAGFMKTCLMLHHRVIPPQPAVTELNPKLELDHSPFRISQQAQPWTVTGGRRRRAAVSSFGFGGTNAHVLVEEAPERTEAKVERDELFLLSAPTPALLASHAAELANLVEAQALWPADVARTLAARTAMDSRIAFVAKGRTALVAELRLVAAGREPSTPLPAEQRQVAFLFPGQGAQRVGLLKDLVDRWPALRRRLESADAASRDVSGSLLDALYPSGPVDAAKAQAHLTQTHVCQPAMAALGVALGELLVQVGVTPSHLLGHSLGEFAAASVAGLLDGPTAVRLVAQRGQFMNGLGLTDQGAMLAVMSDRTTVERAVKGVEGVWFANDNHPTQVVLSGTTRGIEQASAALTQAGLKSTRLDVSHAFHSPLMAGVDAKMAALVDSLPLGEQRGTVVSCITGSAYQGSADAKGIWARHATSEVRFVDALQTCVADGVSTFVQVGAGGALLSFARGVARGEGVSFASLAPADGGDGGAQFLSTLGQLWVKGVPVDLGPLCDGQLVVLPPTPLETQRYWAMERTPRAPRPQLVRAAAAGASVSSQPISSHPKSKGAVPMDNLIALFQQQMTLLQSQAEILKAQANAIASMTGGQPVELTAASFAQVPVAQAAPQGQVAVAMQSVAMPTPAAQPMPHVNGNGHANGHAPVVAKAPNFSNLVGRAEAPESPPAPKADVRPQVLSKVLASVARISAFPAATLKPEQTLVGELGFDSLMLVELDGDVGKAWPSLGGLPRELFSKTTTVTTIVDHIVGVLEGTISTVKAPVASAVDTLPVDRHLPTVTAAPLMTVTESVTAFAHPLLVTKDTHGVAEAVVAKLKARGVAAVLGTVETEGTFSGVVALGLEGDLKAPTRALLALAKKVGAEKAEAFVTVTTLGGRFGYGTVGRAMLGQVGALGFTKALSAEWPDARVKAIDVDPVLGAESIAGHVVDELCSTDRQSEVGYTRDGRVAVSLVKAAKAPSTLSLGKDSVVVITGGAKGLGLSFARTLGKKFGVTVALVGRSAPSDEVAKAASSVKAAGAKGCTYHQADLRDAASVTACLSAIRGTHGRIDVVVHAAGVLADALVATKTTAQVDQVLDTKVTGALALLEATKTSSVQALAFIGSWAGRFGNAAQTDYSAANEMMARLTSVARPGQRLLAIDFPPWAESEMAKKIPAFRKAELKASGVTFLTNDEGLEVFVNELLGGEGEVLVGRDVPERVRAHVSSFPVSRLNHVYLNDHTMAGQRVVPFASALDHVVAAALEASGAVSAPGSTPAFTVSDFTLERTVMVTDTTWLEVAVRQPQRLGQAGPMSVVLSQGAARSYSGTVTLGADAAAAPAVKTLTGGTLPLALSEFYARYTFHGPRLQGITGIDAVAADGISGWVKTSTPADWIKEPLRHAWAVDPLLVDASFQLAGYWAWVTHQRAGFPVSLGRFVQLAPFGRGPVKCTVTFGEAKGDTFAGTLTWQDAKGTLLAYMTGMQAEFTKRDPQFVANETAKATARASAPRAVEPKLEAAPLPLPEAAEAPAAVVPLDEAAWNPEKFPEYLELQERIQMAEAFGLKNPYFSVHESIAGDTTVVGGKTMINFSSYNYVGNSGDPVVSKAASDAIAKYGTSVSASRVASGEKPLTRELELALADFFGTEDCIVMVSGHATNVTVVGHVVGAGDLILHDALAHDSIIQGAKLSGAKRRPFPHNDWEAADRMLTSLRPHYRRVLIAIEGTYSMDGDIPDLPKFIELKKKHKALLLVDEAHSAGVVGEQGRGVGEYFDVNRADVDMWMGTLSKSFASCGGYIAGSHALVEYLKYTAPGFVYSVGIPPPSAAAALAATRQILAHPERVRQAKVNARRFISLLNERGVNTGMSKDSAVVPAIIGNSVLALQLSDAMKDRGINVQPILYPAVEEDQARLRFFMSSLHKDEQLVTAATVLHEELTRLTRAMNGDAA